MQQQIKVHKKMEKVKMQEEKDQGYKGTRGKL